MLMCLTKAGNWVKCCWRTREGIFCQVGFFFVFRSPTQLIGWNDLCIVFVEREFYQSDNECSSIKVKVIENVYLISVCGIFMKISSWLFLQFLKKCFVFHAVIVTQHRYTATFMNIWICTPRSLCSLVLPRTLPFIVHALSLLVLPKCTALPLSRLNSICHSYPFYHLVKIIL